ncbi:hypothetical protein ACFVHB_34870 [Kitasatospora sp. NPDC127111]|uniref:hypothetical protein n=1 Tax=Kitasatospora sp. NPDC127111 TaxID=3345363 RepID=UPI00363D5A24
MEAQILRDLAAVLGRTPEELAIEHAAGLPPIPTEPLADWFLFDHHYRDVLAPPNGPRVEVFPTDCGQ